MATTQVVLALASFATGVHGFGVSHNDTDCDLNCVKNNLDAFFLMSLGMLVFLMQAGFALLEAGAVR